MIGLPARIVTVYGVGFALVEGAVPAIIERAGYRLHVGLHTLTTREETPRSISLTPLLTELLVAFLLAPANRISTEEALAALQTAAGPGAAPFTPGHLRVSIWRLRELLGPLPARILSARPRGGYVLVDGAGVQPLENLEAMGLRLKVGAAQGRLFRDGAAAIDGIPIPPGTVPLLEALVRTHPARTSMDALLTARAAESGQPHAARCDQVRRALRRLRPALRELGIELLGDERQGFLLQLT